MTKTLVLVSRACLSCGEPEATDEGKQIYYHALSSPPLKRCPRCGAGNLLINDSVTVLLREKDPTLPWPKRRSGRPPRNAPPGGRWDD